jgi:hypothetical protein
MDELKIDISEAEPQLPRRFSAASTIALKTASEYLREGNLAEAARVTGLAADLAETERLEATPETREHIVRLMARIRAQVFRLPLWVQRGALAALRRPNEQMAYGMRLVLARSRAFAIPFSGTVTRSFFVNADNRRSGPAFELLL